MRNKTKAICVGLLVAALITLLSGTSAQALEYFPSADAYANNFLLPASVEQSPSYPMRLRIPKLNVVAKIGHVGITEQGNMAAPSNITDVGWYKYGTIPGNIGSAVIAGHVDNRGNLPGVFKMLEDLRPGDEIYVEVTNSERPIRFVVTGTEIYDHNAKVEKVFYQNDAAILRLITCIGGRISENGTREKRLVVTAERIE